MSSLRTGSASPSWADMSKKERQASGMTKKQYNRQGYGGSIGQESDKVRTSDFRDRDGDGTDDRDQHRPGGRNVNAPDPRPGPNPGYGGPRPAPEKPPGFTVGPRIGNGDDVYKPYSNDKEGTTSSGKRKKAQRFKDDYTSKVKKAVRKRKDRDRKRRR